MSIVIFTDGSCHGNGTNNAIGGYACVLPDFPEFNFSAKMSLDDGSITNNRAEYLAFIKALEISNEIDPNLPVTIVTDSMLLKNSLEKWLPGWIEKGWRKADGKPVLNKDLLVIINNLLIDKEVNIIHVSSHTGGKDFYSVWNDKADQLANDAALS